ncbi:MAG: hypothetical protein GY820_40880 [Gammaproteobacteria bacterium]|nr:hypothetical protein [Gammaproteobacteria bacterium]
MAGLIVNLYGIFAFHGHGHGHGHSHGGGGSACSAAAVQVTTMVMVIAMVRHLEALPTGMAHVEVLQPQVALQMHRMAMDIAMGEDAMPTCRVWLLLLQGVRFVFSPLAHARRVNIPMAISPHTKSWMSVCLCVCVSNAPKRCFLGEAMMWVGRVKVPDQRGVAANFV